MDNQFQFSRPRTSRLNTARGEDVPPPLFSIETAALNRHAQIQETKSSRKNDDANDLDWLKKDQPPRNPYSQSVSIETPRVSTNFFQQRNKNPLVLSNSDRVTTNTSVPLPTYTHQPKENQERNNSVLNKNSHENTNHSVTPRTQKPDNIYKISQKEDCVKLLLSANFRDQLGKALNEDYKVTMDITDDRGEQEFMGTDYVIVLGGRPMDIMKAHDAIEVLFETAFTRQVFDKTQGFVIYKIEAVNMVQRCFDHNGIMCHCQLSESDGLIVWYFTTQKAPIKAVSTDDNAVRKILEKHFTSSTIKIPKVWTKEIIDGYCRIMLEFCETISDEDTVVIQQETDHYLLFGSSQSIKTLIASQEKLQKQMLIRSYQLAFEEYQIQFLVLNFQKELKQLEEEFRNSNILSCLQQGYFVAPIPAHAEINERLVEMVSNLTRDTFRIEDKKLSLVLSTQATDLKNIGLKYDCQIDIEETSVPQSCSVPTAALNVKSSEFTQAAMSVDIRRGDLAQQSVDLVVICSTSEHLLNDILSKAGQDIEKDVRASLANKNSRENGFQTKGGDLLCHHLLFLPWLSEKLDDNAARRSIHQFFSTAIQHAIQNRQTSIAFPALGCGKLSYDPNMIAEVILDETQRYLDCNMNILIVLLPEQEVAYAAFCQQLAKLRRKKPPKEQTSISYTQTEMQVTVTGYRQNVEKTSQAILHHLVHCITLEQIDEFPLHNWNQATIDSYFRYCIEHFVLPEVDVKSERLTLVGTKNDVLITSKEFYRVKSMKAEEARLASFARLAVWIYETKRGYTKKYSLKLNALIEDAHHHKKKEISFRNDDNVDCCINFNKMVEKSDQDERLVIRTDFQTPSNWASQSRDVERIRLDPTDSEYVAALNQFNRTMLGNCTIIRIDRIQNRRWYTAYKTFRDYSKQSETEELLFHGCPKTSADMIINTCFNRSFAGVNGVVYGVGVYFSRNASYSDSYAHPNPTNNQRCMFLAKVLVGKTTMGKNTMKVPPTGYDSTTDNNHIIVTYHDDQAYAEYLITYEK